MTEGADILFLSASGLYVAFGLTHVLLVLWDMRRARLFIPADPRLTQEMKDTTLRLSKRLSLLQTYRGLNLSHGLGVLAFGLICSALGWHSYPEVPLTFFATITVVFSTANFLVARRYWPGFPTLGYGFAAALFWLSALMTRF